MIPENGTRKEVVNANTKLLKIVYTANLLSFLSANIIKTLNIYH